MIGEVLSPAVTGIAVLSLAAWLYLTLAHGGFWRTRERLDGAPEPLADAPSVVALVPARNEADVIARSLSSLLAQDYPGKFEIVLIDDHSDDGTAETARETAAATKSRHRLDVIRSRPLPSGWAGKVWALSEGLRHIESAPQSPDYILLTDADLEHDPANLRRLVSKARSEDLDLVSQMVVLVSQGSWASLLIPAFVLFFQKLYPFAWVNDPKRRTAAAAGGCVLLRRQALERIDGFNRMQGALIDDCALAALIKKDGREEGGRLWLGLTRSARSLRPYEGLAGVWRMVARSAFTQLRYSTLLLLGTTAGMAVLYWLPPLIALMAWAVGAPLSTVAASAAWFLMALNFTPILRFYGCPPYLALLLPVAGFLYSLMTISSAIEHWRGRGGTWKGRTEAGRVDSA